jgi:hypothetical protein
MEPPLASVEELEYRLGRTFTSEELPRVEALLDDVSAFVRAEAGVTWIDPETGLLLDVPASVRAVVLRVAERVMRNPQGFRSESAGDYSYQRPEAGLGLMLTEAELRIIRRAVGRTGLWTQPLTRGTDELCATLWVEDSYGCELFPLTAEGD